MKDLTRLLAVTKILQDIMDRQVPDLSDSSLILADKRVIVAPTLPDSEEAINVCEAIYIP